jgi:hypothetical protein
LVGGIEGFGIWKGSKEEMLDRSNMTPENKYYHCLGGSVRDNSGLGFFAKNISDRKTIKASTIKVRQTKKGLPQLNNSFIAQISDSSTKAGTS